MVRWIANLWNGRVPLVDAFWTYGVFWTVLLNMVTTLTSLALVVADAPAWAAVAVHFAPLPWNLLVLVAVWRSAGDATVPPRMATAARAVIIAWVAFLTVI